MDIPIYDIDYNQHTGYYNIVNNATGERFGEYLEYEKAVDAFHEGGFDPYDLIKTTPDEEDELPEGEYVVCREYVSHQQHYVMFTRGRLSDHVSYPESSTVRSKGFNDTSIKIYNSMKEAKRVADTFNRISREKKLYKYANWQALMKWW